MEPDEENTYQKLKHIIQEYRMEFLFLFLALTGVIISFWFFITVYKGESETKINIIKDEKEIENGDLRFENDERIFIDISGAVNKPGLYELSPQSRIKDALEKAQGLSTSADSDFFNRNYNLARILVDQEKIYVPSKQEVVNGVFIEGVYTIGQSNISQKIASEKTQGGDKVNINNASQKELESLPGIGPVTARKIIESRPYSSAEELVEKKIVSQKMLDEIKSLIILQ
ncbi:hypothetical protein A3H80_04620 [Candidatus Roizmanbacteria bacterium RIFCSPLOWO2_02_FULL_37_19]|uniref:Helix-hairpin-helix DNA-binding motif class 1 domain-containing protein n=1 Tax=Candidatus Roizmanbacteria bacterium RIFCSPHIGHO2_02_FULL_37_24 TaxID=1802037 RepID=A0A1F7GUT0_9BACT|nr:MAG: hypothetical protein A2862_04180 [Candidatus Roizmanbacteria bacterium RIFCSPHIGHO2_01_FULL_38_41]OGK22760.1 MAG: hypothetical protein A3C24_01665 [Candidatus Roizmanbacteria bacterium RIFCSPHIGHO2_02_FULL_37_24]OGK32095.1 MAG: hypothetical protein A3E10_02555 [Candidatus Roizmanbacteria bacterium RIFCSPHIGHO2_12_FULL_37_23]OGK44400.1 MAG: hypothetical protein A2956_03395 [Candidatus Roizmanbacteria bacterium RIFCSPLOWO2_01_FULL_37_57]OGK54137.1 MAG: hypothetical protein A3H80_04620 [Ca